MLLVDDVCSKGQQTEAWTLLRVQGCVSQATEYLLSFSVLSASSSMCTETSFVISMKTKKALAKSNLIWQIAASPNRSWPSYTTGTSLIGNQGNGLETRVKGAFASIANVTFLRLQQQVAHLDLDITIPKRKQKH